MAEWIGAQRCGTCKFSFGEGRNIVCRRLPPFPQVMMSMTPQGPAPTGCISNFPPVQDRQWCGEYVRGMKPADQMTIEAEATRQ